MVVSVMGVVSYSYVRCTIFAMLRFPISGCSFFFIQKNRSHFWSFDDANYNGQLVFTIKFVVYFNLIYLTFDALYTLSCFMDLKNIELINQLFQFFFTQIFIKNGYTSDFSFEIIAHTSF